MLRHVEVAVPNTPGWVAIVADALQGHGTVHVMERASEERLRGRGEPGALAGASGGIVVIDVHDVRADKPSAALSEAVTLGTVLPLPMKKKGEEDKPLVAAEAEVLVVVVGPDSILKKWRDERPRVAGWIHRRISVSADVLAERTSSRLLAERLRRFAASADLGRPRVSALERLIEDSHAHARRGRLLDDTTFAEDALLEAGPKADRAAVDEAITRLRDRRANREIAHRERLTNGRLRVTASGATLGVVNGLMVYGSGRAAYTIPGRVSARVGVGSEGVINVEREAKYSGRSFDKGVFLLTGFLRATFGRTAPLGMTASLAFEQSYGGIDGDSATIAETTAILSALSGLPCTQSIAVTGAMNQRGDVLPVGSLSVKLMGWWEASKALGADAAGAIIPAANVLDLHLSPELVAAVDAGQFSIYAIDRVEQALEILLDCEAGVSGPRGYPDDTVFGAAAATLNRMSARLYPTQVTTLSETT